MHRRAAPNRTEPHTPGEAVGRTGPGSLPAGALSDLSVHMCFICVLHLANEHGLAIEGVASLDELRIVAGPRAA